MNNEIEKLIIKSKGFDKDALEAMNFLAKIYTYGLYGEKKDLNRAEFWSTKANELKQQLSKNISVPYNIKKENIKINRFDNIQNNLKFVGSKDITNDIDKTSINRFNNIQHNLKFVGEKDTNK